MFAHSIHGLECAKEERATRRALFLPDSEELATVPGSETFGPFFNADIRTLLFSADVLKKCALIVLHAIAEEERDREVGCRAHSG